MASDGLYNDDWLAGSQMDAGAQAAQGSVGKDSDAVRVQRVRQRHTQLESERSTWDPTYRDISSFIQPRHGRFFTSDRNKGDRKDLNIVNNTATRASRIKAAGIMSGLTNPATPWIRFSTPDPELNEYDPVQRWLSTLADRLLWAFSRSNIYLALHSLYADLDFGTGAVHIEEDTERLFRAYIYPIGSYCLANSWRQRIDTVYRRFQMTAAQLVERFGIDKCSGRTQSAYKNNQPDYWSEVIHAVEPNRDLQRGQLSRQGMPWRSCWLEQSSDENKGFLSEQGYREFPDMCPRWDVNGEDVYGTGSGHDAIGDSKALQTLERRKAQLVDKIATPAMQLPSAMRNDPVSMLPNSLLFVDGMGPAQAVRPVYEPNPNGLMALEASIREHEKRIDQAFGVDVWIMFANDPQGQMTATEVLRRREEKMLLMGPYLMRLDEELLNPLVDRCTSILMRRGVMPVPPPELQGMDIRVEYQSVLAQAQRAVGIQSIYELVNFTGTLAKMQLAAGGPAEAMDKLDTDEAVDEFAERLGTRPELVRSKDDVAATREARAQQRQQAAQMQQAQQAAEVAKTASGASLDGDNVLARVLPAIAGQRS